MSVVAVADPTYGPSTCDDCGAPIVWALWEAGHRIAIDRDPHEEGHLVYGQEEDQFHDVLEPGVVRARRATEDDPPAPRWRMHFDTCPVRRRPPARAKGGPI